MSAGVGDAGTAGVEAVGGVDGGAHAPPLGGVHDGGVAAAAGAFDNDPVVGARWPELGVSGFLVATAVLVIADSLRVGIGWADDGPRSGYFPFAIGVLLLLSSGAIFIGQLLRWRQAPGVFAARSQLALVVAVWVPMVVFVGLIFGLGLYVAAALLIAYFMRRHGHYGWPTTAAVAAGVPLVCFLVFERWFLVQLPKGPLEGLLGL